MAAMTIKKRRPKPDWESIKKYIAARMHEQRAWVRSKIKAERDYYKQQLDLRDETYELVARGLQEALAALERDS